MRSSRRASRCAGNQRRQSSSVETATRSRRICGSERWRIRAGYADYAVGFDGDPVWKAAKDRHLKALVEIHTTGQPRAIIFQGRAATARFRADPVIRRVNAAGRSRRVSSDKIRPSESLGRWNSENELAAHFRFAARGDGERLRRYLYSASSAGGNSRRNHRTGAGIETPARRPAHEHVHLFRSGVVHGLVAGPGGERLRTTLESRRRLFPALDSSARDRFCILAA